MDFSDPHAVADVYGGMYRTFWVLTLVLFLDIGILDRLRSWSDFLEATDRRPKTIKQYRYWLLRFAADTVVDPWDVTEDELVAYIAAMPKTGTSRHAFLQAMTSYWRWAAPRAGRDPTAKLHIRRPPDRKAPHIAPEVFRDILREAFHREQRRGWTLLLLFSTGIRVGSLIELRPEDVADGLLQIREAKGGRPYEVPLVQLSEPAANWLVADAKANDRETLVGVGAEQVRNWLREARIAAGVPDARRGSRPASPTRGADRGRRPRQGLAAPAAPLMGDRAGPRDRPRDVAPRDGPCRPVELRPVRPYRRRAGS